MSLSEGALKAFETLKQACMNSPVLAYADYTKDFLLETDASKEGLGAVLSQKQEDGWFHPVAYGSQVLTLHEKNYHSTKPEFFGTEVGRNGALQGIPAIPTLPGIKLTIIP